MPSTNMEVASHSSLAPQMGRPDTSLCHAIGPMFTRAWVAWLYLIAPTQLWPQRLRLTRWLILLHLR